jgi:predicted O-methyltransferase YrrM
MSGTLAVTKQIEAYLESPGMRNHPVLRRCEQAAMRDGRINRQIANEEGALLAMLARLLGAKRYLEVGTYFGYSALAVGLALPKTGKAVCLDIDPDAMAVARRFWAQAGLASIMDGRVGDAHKLIRAMIAKREKPFDMVFIDADKEGYDDYYECALKLTRQGGLIAFDNMLRDGLVAFPKKRDAFARAAHALNRKIQRDKRVDMVLVPVGDGVMLARKR